MKDNSYSKIIKATAIFGGVQVFGIIVNIIRSKFIAVLLGPSGMGVFSLLSSAIGIVGNLTNFGLTTSAVKNIASANSTNDIDKISRVVGVFRAWVWITGSLGFIVALILAPYLSQWSFGNGKYTIAFLAIAVTLLITQISAGQGVVLRGMRQINYLAQSSIIGSALGLVTSIPLYYFFGQKGIVPAIIVTSITSLCLSWYFSRRLPIKKVQISKAELLSEGKEMLSLGFMLSLSALAMSGSSYLLRIFISKQASIADIGLYNAGFAIINSYVGLIFTAISADFYPRLAGVADDNVKSAREVNQQAEVAILILAPILCFFLIFVNWAVIILYSEKFLAINSMVHWLALGMFFKACSWAAGYLVLAKGKSRMFFWNELVTNIYMLGFNILGFYLWGLTGLGISFLVSYFIYFLQITILTKKYFEFSYSRAFLKLFLIQFLLGLVCFFTCKVFTGLMLYSIGSFLILLSIAFSLWELNKRMDLKGILLKFKKKS